MARKPSKRYISETIESVEIPYNITPVDEFINKLNSLAEKAKEEGYKNISICEVETDDSYGTTEIRLKGERLETDKEYVRRCKNTESQKKRRKREKEEQEEWEKEEYERLKAKFTSSGTKD